MSEEKLYHKLRKHLHTFPLGYPVSGDGVEIDILKEIFTPDQARLALLLSYIPLTERQIKRKLLLRGKRVPDLSDRLETMYKKGALYKISEPKATSYFVPTFAIGFYEYQLNRMSEKFARNSRNYLDGAYAGELTRTGIPQLRTIPIQKSLRAEHHVASHDDIEQIIKAKKGTFAIANCICRQTGDMNGQPCKHTDIRETCLLFDHTAEHWIDLGIARSATKEEILVKLSEAQEAGLVLQPTSIQDPTAICCCCGCCCGLLVAAGKAKNPAEVVGSNYRAEIDPAQCTGCKRCLKHCHTNAISYADKKCTISPERCIGCGTCIPLCKFHAIQLQKKQKSFIPFENMKQLYLAVLNKKSGPLAVIKDFLTSRF